MHKRYNFTSSSGVRSENWKYPGTFKLCHWKLIEGKRSEFADSTTYIAKIWSRVQDHPGPAAEGKYVIFYQYLDK